MHYDFELYDDSLPRREREKLMHRAEIMRAAERIFAQKGFNTATLDEIAQEAEFSKGAIYNYFSSKEDLLYSIISCKQATILREIRKVIDEDLDFRDTVTRLMEKATGWAFEDRDFSHLLISMHMTGFRPLSDERAEEVGRFHKMVDSLMLERIDRAKAGGELRDVSSDAVYGILHGSFEHMLISRWGFDDVAKLRKAVTAFLDILFNGIAAHKEAHSV